jgi:hypothetical protein
MVFITLTVLDSPFVTYTLLPSELTDTPAGFIPTLIESETVFVARLITDTVLEF